MRTAVLPCWVVIAACSPNGAAPVVPRATAASPAPSASTSATARELDAAAPATAPRTGAFYPVYEGACSASMPFRVGGGVVHRFSQRVWSLKEGRPQVLFAHTPQAMYGLTSHLGDVGGIDEAHAWAFVLTPARGEGFDATPVFAALGWKPPDVAEAVDSSQGTWIPYFSGFIEQPDGSLWGHVQLAIGSSGIEKNLFMAWSPEGKRLQAKLPGPDMRGAERLSTGELVAADLAKNERPVLRRWSPVRPVDDLVVADAPVSSSSTLRVAGAAAVLGASETRGKVASFYRYAGAGLVPSKLNSEHIVATSWTLLDTHELLATTRDGTLWVEGEDGTVRREPLPEPGELAREPSVAWLLGKSGAPYQRVEGTWRKVALPDGPWTPQGHAPVHIEWLRVVGNETLVGTVRTDLGFGKKKPAQVRTVYSTGRVPRALRCGPPFDGDELGELLPAAPSCETPILVVGREPGAGSAKVYTALAAALKGAPGIGESLEVVAFGSEKRALVGIRVKSEDVGKAVESVLGRTQSYVPERVCGSIVPVRTLHFDVRSGALSPAP